MRHSKIGGTGSSWEKESGRQGVKCYGCGGLHIVKYCPERKKVLDAMVLGEII